MSPNHNKNNNKASVATNWPDPVAPTHNYITHYRTAVTHFEHRLRAASSAHTDFYTTCIATLKAEIVHLETLDPEAEMVFDKDAQVCYQVDQVQCTSERVKLPRPGMEVLGDEGIVECFRELVREIGEKKKGEKAKK